MQINQINNFDKCCKPRRFGNFKGSGESSQMSEGKVRYKHFEQLSDDVLSVRSIVKAHRDAEQSTKMKLLKAAPAIAAGLTGISIGLTQPGKLSAKAASGLGFLAALTSVDLISDGLKKATIKDVYENPSSDKNRNGFLLKLLGVGLAALSAGSLLKGSKAGDFLSKEASKLAGEINGTKLGKFTAEKIEPFIQKHPKLNAVMSMVLPIGTIIGGALAENKLANDVCKDIEIKANENFAKAKEIQKIAREEFDAVDAEEV